MPSKSKTIYFDAWGHGIQELIIPTFMFRLLPTQGYADYYIDNWVDLIRWEHIPEEALTAYLKEFGAWDAEDLTDHEQNKKRTLWSLLLDWKEESHRKQEEGLANEYQKITVRKFLYKHPYACEEGKTDGRRFKTMEEWWDNTQYPDYMLWVLGVVGGFHWSGKDLARVFVTCECEARPHIPIEPLAQKFDWDSPGWEKRLLEMLESSSVIQGCWYHSLLHELIDRLKDGRLIGLIYSNLYTYVRYCFIDDDGDGNMMVANIVRTCIPNPFKEN